MDRTMKFIENHVPKTDDRYLEIMSQDNVLKANHFHKSFPEYHVTPLHSLRNLAQYLGIKNLYVKDESYRFGLNAFKVLGGSFAIARYIAKQTGRDVSELPYNVLTSDALREEFGHATFFTATDGNHGRGVAWAANRLGQKAVVRMPKGTTPTRLENIRKLGAEVTIEELNYDECVRMAAAEAAQTENGVIVQDTAWDGYEEIPSWIMQGYGTLALEADRQMLADGCERPTHVIIQAGVGSLAGAVIGYFANRYRDNPPVMVVVEANAADCLYRSAEQATGELVNVTGDMVTIMAGLACGEGNTIAWDILRNHAAAFVSCPDWMSARGTRVYGVPMAGDPEIISGESGSVTMGFLSVVMARANYADIRAALKLDENSEVLLVSTEGNTDPVRFREVVWDGLYGIREPFAEDDVRKPR
ncbi:diaminopropionate ammonia-lyase [Butyricicoccus sp.]|uniref:diaminopropionate ammonia-lyase n=1 Tax=Butyricicoccus sp. TaxID=2049021 RepID=UPI003F179DCB